MVDGRENNKGQTGSKNGGGRKSKAIEQKLIEKLTPMNPMALKSLKKALVADKPWAIRLYFEYFYGRPHQRIDITSGDEPFQINPLFSIDLIDVPTDNSPKKDS